MIKEKADLPKKNNWMTASKRKIYLGRLGFNANDLNLRENMGISEMRRKQNVKIRGSKKSGCVIKRLTWGIWRGTNTREVKKMALAGVGRPMKDSLWRTSMLNLAKRKAEKMAIRNGQYSRNVSRYWSIEYKVKMYGKMTVWDCKAFCITFHLE